MLSKDGVHKSSFVIDAFMSGFYFFYFALVGVYIIFLPQMLLQSGFSAIEVGIIYSAAPFMRFLLPFVFLHFVKLTHGVYKISLIVTLLITVWFYFAIDDFYTYLIANLIFGSSMGVALPFVEIIALKVIKKERYGKIRLWGSIGFTAIALLLGQILTSPKQGLAYLAMMAFATMVFGYIVIGYDGDEDKGINLKEQNRGFSLVKYWAFWLSAFLLQVSFGGFYNFFTIYETSHGISLETTSYLWSFSVLCEIVLFYYQGNLLKRNLLLLLQFAITTAIIRWMLLWLYPDSIWVAYLSQSLHAFSFALYYTAIISYVYNLYEQKRLAQQFLLGLSFGLGGSVGAFIAGVIYDYDKSMLFGVEAFVAFLSLWALYIHANRRRYIDASV